MYSIEFTSQFNKQLKKLDKSVQKLIVKWLKNNLYNCENPRLHGKALTANLSVYWRYRIADYRLIVEIKDDKVVVVAVSISHRRDVYKLIKDK